MMIEEGEMRTSDGPPPSVPFTADERTAKSAFEQRRRAKRERKGRHTVRAHWHWAVGAPARRDLSDAGSDASASLTASSSANGCANASVNVYASHDGCPVCSSARLPRPCYSTREKRAQSAHAPSPLPGRLCPHGHPRRHSHTTETRCPSTPPRHPRVVASVRVPWLVPMVSSLEEFVCC